MATDTADGTLLVPVSNPETVERLIDTAVDIARGRSLRILALHVVEVPAQVPLSEGHQLVEEDGEERRVLADARERVEAADVPVETTLRYARDVATGIVGAVGEHDADGLLLGWHGRPRRRDIILGSFIDRVLAEADCDVFVKRIRRPARHVDSILVPVADGPHSDLAVDLAGALATEHDASVRLVHVVASDADDAAVENANALLKESAGTLPEGLDIETDVLQHDHVPGAINDETTYHDLTILGATRDPFLRRKLVGSVAEGVGRSAASAVMLVRSEPEE
ncbi:universal stress protein [Natranaeroarchaeum sulfidigenes]|uniref:Nucleotide-binding protein, UspA family n=1 Tax=Natranaeroarchaeum sulfidigenes TaxID=2784880 RepID=A0A897MLW8_9EURY|nr:universal stress protein [Natranaeroarchaeum sulfidigenes]QSG01361.1 Nucleotide-binding protein, UspA family [Natranaeroarchaeum sulfidigenes]